MSSSPSAKREEIKLYQNISAKNSFLFRGLLVSDSKDHGSSFTCQPTYKIDSESDARGSKQNHT